LLERKTLNLRTKEKEDADFLYECLGDLDFWGKYIHPGFEQTPRWYLLNLYDNPSNFQEVIELKTFIIQKKDGTRIGVMFHYIVQPYGTMSLSCFLVPKERGKGYGVEATQLMVDHLFLHRDIVRI
jgi:RimJ/RimL family protein N-acetyltransferase